MWERHALKTRKFKLFLLFLYYKVIIKYQNHDSLAVCEKERERAAISSTHVYNIRWLHRLTEGVDLLQATDFGDMVRFLPVSSDGAPRTVDVLKDTCQDHWTLRWQQSRRYAHAGHEAYNAYGTTQTVQCWSACFQCRNIVRQSGILWQIICVVRLLNLTLSLGVS